MCIFRSYAEGQRSAVTPGWLSWDWGWWGWGGVGGEYRGKYEVSVFNLTHSTQSAGVTTASHTHPCTSIVVRTFVNLKYDPAPHPPPNTNLPPPNPILNPILI